MHQYNADEYPGHCSWDCEPDLTCGLHRESLCLYWVGVIPIVSWKKRLKLRWLLKPASPHSCCLLYTSHPTTHHNGDLEGLWKRFMERDFEEMLLFYVWGHSFEFDRENTWDKMEAFCQMAADNENVWYATNIEIKDYITAVRGLVYSEDGKMIYNPSCQSVWLTVDGEPVCIPAGALWKK